MGSLELIKERREEVLAIARRYGATNTRKEGKSLFELMSFFKCTFYSLYRSLERQRTDTWEMGTTRGFLEIVRETSLHSRG